MGVAQSRRVWAMGAGAAVVACAAVAAVVIARGPRDRNKNLPEAQARADEREGSDPATPVKAVHPRKDASLRVSVRQLLSVEPFFQTDLRSRVAGVVSQVPKSLGARVRAGDLLVAIDVPDLDQEVVQKTAVVRQRVKDVETSRAALAVAEAQVAVARQMIAQRKAEVDEAVETREYRQIRYERFDAAVKAGGIQRNMADEEWRNYRAAYFKVAGAEAALHKAEADVTEKESLRQEARADVELKEALVEVARKDYAVAEARAGYARVTAPFNGEVVARNVVEGSFVQNASTGQTEPMITLARTDIVTVVMKVPDNFAPYVGRDTEAEMEFDDLPGLTIHGKVTRYSRSIRNRDRTMRVEVDLWNDTPAKYDRFAARCVGNWLSPLGAAGPLQLATLMTNADRVWSKHSKDRADPFPVLPAVSGVSDAPPELIPGMSGYMRLQLREFKGAYLLPSSTVFSRGGRPYILEVRDGKSHLLPVRVQVNDGRLAKVAVIVQPADPARGKGEVLRPLTGNETIILNRQVEIGDEQPVEVTLDEDP
jgi:multidrug resistance efflux pump